MGNVGTLYNDDSRGRESPGLQGIFKVQRIGLEDQLKENMARRKRSGRDKHLQLGRLELW